jgi:hypothetical protein
MEERIQEVVVIEAGEADMEMGTVGAEDEDSNV